MRYQKKPKPSAAEEPEQYQLFDTPEYSYRVFVTNMKDADRLLAWFYSQRAGAENLIKEANNDAGLAAHPSARWAMNCNHFQLAMLAYNLNCWLMLFNREEEAKVADSAVTPRWRRPACGFCSWRPRSGATPGRVGVSYSDHYAEQGLFQRLMDRLRTVTATEKGFAPVIATALRC